MNRQHALPSLLPALLLFLFAGSAGAFEADISDTNVTAAVEREFMYDHAVPFHEIDVWTNDGVVDLSGSVDNILAKSRAVRVAETVKGVRSIVDRIDVRPSEGREDDAIRSDIDSALFEDPATDSFEIAVEVEGGHVTLNGSVQSWKERELCATVAKGVRGVTGLTNAIEVQYRTVRPDPEMRKEIEQALHWNSLVDDALIHVTVSDGSVSLTGTVGSAAEKRLARYEAWTNGVREVDVSGLIVSRWARDDDLRQSKYGAVEDDEIRGALEDALATDPRVYSFQVVPSVDTGHVTLRGTVDNLKAKRAAEMTARNTVGVLSVNNHLRVRPDIEVGHSEMEQQIRDAFQRDPILWPFDVGVRAYAGTVYLSGVVDTYFERARADDLAAGVPGVVEVRNNLRVNSYAHTFDPWVDDWPLYEFDWYQPRALTQKTDVRLEADIQNELWWSPFVNDDDINVVVDDGVATLTGSVDSWMELGAAQDNAYDAGAKSVDNRLKVQ